MSGECQREAVRRRISLGPVWQCFGPSPHNNLGDDMLGNTPRCLSTLAKSAAAKDGGAAFKALNASVQGKLSRQSSAWYFATIEDGAVVGERSAVLEHATVGANAKVGQDSVVGPRARIGQGATVGSKVRIGAGAVVASNAVVPDNTVLAPGALFPSAAAAPAAADAGAAHVLALAQAAQADWSLSPEELRKRRVLAESPHSPDEWATYVASNPNPIKHPERKGLVFD
jgi:carbonic anhydrase/acetyltransferase-like protein (isoleucine patch superfamily)